MNKQSPTAVQPPYTMVYWTICAISLAAWVGLPACGSASRHGSPSGGARFDYSSALEAGPTPAPNWVERVEVSSHRLCGIGVAGAGFNAQSPYPKELSEERAINNLAGVLGTRVQEAIVDRTVNTRINIELARALTVDDSLIERVRSLAETEYWLDVAGEGPYASKGYTYAHTCIDAKVAADTFEIDQAALTSGGDSGDVDPLRIPGWIAKHGTQTGGRLCAVGFSLPMFHADKTFQGVVEDIRGQLAEVLQTLVSSYYEELTTNRGQMIEAMNVATTEAISKGAIVTHYWYDRDGIGPFARNRTTYGWGCVYPVEVIKQSVAAVEADVPEEEKDVIAKVRERAEMAFDDLEAEIDKREGRPGPTTTAPTTADSQTADSQTVDASQPTTPTMDSAVH